MHLAAHLQSVSILPESPCALGRHLERIPLGIQLHEDDVVEGAVRPTVDLAVVEGEFSFAVDDGEELVLECVVVEGADGFEVLAEGRLGVCAADGRA